MSNKISKENLKINKNKLKLYISNKIFKPTATTEFLIRDVLSIIKKPLSVLDLGCGTGVVGIMVNKFLKNKKKIYASDVSGEAIKIAEKNDDEGNRIYNDLKEEYLVKYMPKPDADPHGSIDDFKDVEKNTEVKRVKELKSNFLNKYIYSAVGILILLLVAIFYFVSR